MKLEIDHSKKLVSVRLTQAESGDQAVQAQLRALCPTCCSKNNLTVFGNIHPENGR